MDGEKEVKRLLDVVQYFVSLPLVQVLLLTAGRTLAIKMETRERKKY